MRVQPPFLYDPVKAEGPGSPHKDFDPKVVTRASYMPKLPRQKPEGPLISFNQHPEYVYHLENYRCANNGSQFLLNSALWKERCEADEFLSEEVGEMDEDHPIGLEIFRTTVRSWDFGYDDPY
jgi:hypothetical protein